MAFKVRFSLDHFKTTNKTLKDFKKEFEKKDISLPIKNKKIGKELLSEFINLKNFDHSTKLAICAPLETSNYIFSTSSFDSIMHNPEEVTYMGRTVEIDQEFMVKQAGYFLVLKKFYGLDCGDIYFKSVHKFFHKTSKSYEYYHLNFVDIHLSIYPIKEPPKFSKEKLEEIKSHLHDLDYLESLIPSDSFCFDGFIVIQFTNVTTEEIIHQIQEHFIDDAQKLQLNFVKDLNKLFEQLLRLNGLRTSFGGFTGIETIKVSSEFEKDYSCIYKDTLKIPKDDFENSRLFKNLKYQDNFNVFDGDDLEKNISSYDDELIDYGAKSIVYLPLESNGKPIGFFEICSKTKHHFNYINIQVLTMFKKMFESYLVNSMANFNQLVQDVIQNKCTAIHPNLKWKFELKAKEFLQNKINNNFKEMDVITFKNVYPLFGVSDIRSSTNHRNRAIETDLTEQLFLAKKIITKANESTNVPIYQEVYFQIKKFIKILQRGISAGDEFKILNFLSFEFNPMLELLSKNNLLTSHIENYNKMIDNEFGFNYKKRKMYEDSIHELNYHLAEIMDEEQVEIQNFAPHYFEKHLTDGIDHSIYVGESLNEHADNSKFSDIHLKNLKIWQLKTMVKYSCMAEKIKSDLSYKLELAHLIVVQNTPLSIRFDYEEKQMTVDGAYNIRYEIIKKRIDKALIRGTKRRLTKVGHIAIVYSQNAEKDEYLGYLEYLVHSGFLKDKIELLDLEDLQGVKGLKAIRVKMNLQKFYSKSTQHLAPLVSTSSQKKAA